MVYINYEWTVITEGAITWMKENQGTTVDIFTFNVRRPEFNCFPSDEDKDKIETKVYTEKRYQACRKLKGQLMWI